MLATPSSSSYPLLSTRELSTTLYYCRANCFGDRNGLFWTAPDFRQGVRMGQPYSLITPPPENELLLLVCPLIQGRTSKIPSKKSLWETLVYLLWVSSRSIRSRCLSVSLSLAPYRTTRSSP